MTPKEFESIGNQACVSVAAGHDCMWQGDLLEPHLWEALRVELQRRYRRSTGETMAVLSIDNAPSPQTHLVGLKRYEPVSNCSESDMAEHPNGDWVRLDDVSKSLRANPVEWEGDEFERYGMHEFGYYLIIKAQGGYSLSAFTNKGAMRPMGFHKALDDAESEAQTDYQRRILSCLATAPEDGR